MERWTDQQILMNLHLALGYINAAPLQTTYTVSDMPSAWETPTVIGGALFCLFG